MNFFADRFFGWMTYEPVIGLMMVISALVLFLANYKKSEKQETFWEWGKRVIESLVIVLLFLGLLWSFRAILTNCLQRK
ncbi:hypothetical protein HZC34_00760 [Candidatus Saganbacteria bacterium]|nr:hypothetical protein [Candidatus Saganbacteria bacterium]